MIIIIDMYYNKGVVNQYQTNLEKDTLNGVTEQTETTEEAQLGSDANIKVSIFAYPTKLKAIFII